MRQHHNVLALRAADRLKMFMALWDPISPWLRAGKFTLNNSSSRADAGHSHGRSILHSGGPYPPST